MPPLPEESEPHNTGPAIGEELSQPLQENEQRLEREARDAQARFRARTFQRDVEAAASSTRAVTQFPLMQPHQVPTIMNRAGSANVAGIMSLDSLIVQIIAKAHANPLAGPARELQDLVSQLPSAVHAERAVYEARITNLAANANGHGNGNPSGYVDLDAQREIHSLKSQNGSLKSDVKRLEEARKKTDTLTQKKIGKLNQTISGLRSTDNAKEIQNLKTLNGSLKADLKRLEQAASDSMRRSERAIRDSQTGGSVASTAIQATASTTFTPSFANGTMEQPTATVGNPTPIANLQPRFQLGDRYPAQDRSPAQDPRPQLYTASPSGFFFQPPLARDAQNPFKGNDKQIIHPARLGQLDKASVSTVHNQSVANVTPPVFSTRRPVSMPIAKPESTGQDQGGQHQQFKDPGTQTLQSLQSLIPPTARCALPSDTWQATFGDLFKRPSSQGAQMVSSDGSQEVPAPPSQDPRLMGRVSTTTCMKRVASPEIEKEAPKKIKVETTEDEEVTGAQPGAEQVEPMSNQATSTIVHTPSTISMPVSMVEQVQEQPVEADGFNSNTQAVVGNAAAISSISKSKEEVAGPGDRVQSPPEQTRKDSGVASPLASPGPAEMAQSPNEKERKHSGVASSVALPEPTTPKGRQSSCLTCRFGQRECDQKSPCNNCTANGFDCKYWKCVNGEACHSPTCWYTHEPAEGDPNGQPSDVAVGRSDLFA